MISQLCTSMSTNSSSCLLSSSSSSLYDDPLCLKSSYTPWYYVHDDSLIDGFSDYHLAIAAPVLAYWSLSLVFHFLDTRTWRWLDKYRIHPSTEVASRNTVSRTAVVWAVVFQHFIQTLLGLWWLSEAHERIVDHTGPVKSLALTLRPLLALLGLAGHNTLLKTAELVYWWAIPVFQLFAAMFIIDTWQYFFHRAMHVNKFLYKHFHSWHHRLYVPYAFGSLYNHPVEGFVLDSLGTALAESLTGMNTRQAMLLFSISTFKTVDDHCGYNFPWDPLQMFSGNNADYHDIHHQVIGIKSNFAQPFFVHWDTLLGTRMTREDIQRRRESRKNVAGTDKGV
ncbi:sphingosine hydroxylase [Coprinopsis sp. MPI-PUGE-AT-0042]|nr:sphingosine hydroxylase [Coprinopsis sp. MPI-PUGE-AT-0042]